MCGIVGIVGCKEKLGDMLLDSIKKLEYRGYDSAGITTVSENKILIRKDVGKIDEVNKKVNFSELKGNIGLGHTRWATCGRVTKENSHPHTDCKEEISIVHNGIIENHSELKKELIEKGHKFQSETDTEVIAHLIEDNYDGDIKEATTKALKKIEGSYALGIISAKEPEKLIAARNESPLIIGVGKNENFIASDVPAILSHTKKIIYLDNKELAVLTQDNITVFDLNGNEIKKEINEIDWNAEMAEKQGYTHFMLKEIHEQPRALTETINGRIKNNRVDLKEELNLSSKELSEIKRIVIVACGTSWHAALAGEFMFEELAKISTEVEYASEFRYRHPIISKDDLLIAISQSGETADTLAALREAKKQGAKILSICNVKGSSIDRESDIVLYTHAGPEIGVASTKAFTTQLVVLYLLTLYLSQLRKTLDDNTIQDLIANLRKLPLQLEKVFNNEEEIKKLANIYYNKSNALYLGRGVNYPIALEGALKLKEISYIHAEGYPAAEMKHGPIALIDKEMPVIFVAPKDIYTYKKVLSNIEEVKARGGIVIVIATEGDEEIKKIVDHVIYIPKNLYTLSSILAVVPLQLLAYYIAKKRGCDIDRPKNLSKVVTVE
ncbi:glutamine--fructose-6-phosphate transaminase (isomerizing) [Candidatus Woesearchaeota archaeon]|nr:glutamine--fructose-6-phosphate transaminase (isomerizing) [Candidatus Woesearchaeota archaeon]